MKLLLSILLFITTVNTHAQKLPRIDSIRNRYTDSLIKDTLVALAMKNPAFAESDALIKSAELELKQTKSAWLNTLVLSGNINEFVITNSTVNGIPAATLYPKYNVGVNIPLGLFTRQEKNISREKIKIYEAQKESRFREIRKIVLMRYENFKEKKELLELQKQITDGQYSTYMQKQRDYARGSTTDIKEVNKEYELWIDQRSKQRTREKELVISELELEEITGVTIAELIKEVGMRR